MIGKQSVWKIGEYNKEKAGCFAAELGISPLVTGILLERDFSSPDEMREFLYGSATPFHNPFLMKGMRKAVERIEQAIAAQEQITVYGDYDVDGITASSLLYIYFKRRGANVNTYIPQRKSEGYGLNDEALKTIFESGTSLVITVDCGISGLHEVESAPKELDIIITDHHTVPEILPPAYAIVNPKQEDCDYPFKELSGVGVAFKLCQAMELGSKAENEVPAWENLTELAALGTVADIVPLLGENREIVRRGLKAMENTELVGLRALMEASGCPKTNIISENIGFGLAPRLNAVGRLEHAQSAVELLVTDDAEKAKDIAVMLNHENTLRQEISRNIMEEAEAMLAQEEHIDTAIVLASEGWHQGVIGIVASRLVDKYHLPTILISIDGDMAKGSCRSIEALNLYEAIAAESDLLTQFGGHHQAAGLTLPTANLPEFKRRFKAYVREHLQEEDYLPVMEVDSEICTQLTVRDLEELQLLEPCGCRNRAPVFAFRNALLRNERAMGKDKTHLQFMVNKGDYSYRAVMWNKACLLPVLFDNMIADIAFQPKINEWRGEFSVQLRADAIRQRFTLGDLRHSGEDKQRLLEAFARIRDKVQVLVSSLDNAPQLEGELSRHVELLTYEQLMSQLMADKSSDKHHAEEHGFELCESILLYDIPELQLKSLLTYFKKHGVNQVILLFTCRDMENAISKAYVDYPHRDAMTGAYRMVMGALEKQGQIKLDDLPNCFNGRVSVNALKIMEQLGFITINNGIIGKGVIRRCQLEDAPFYSSVQHKRQTLLNIYKENLHQSQHDLLRG